MYLHLKLNQQKTLLLHCFFCRVVDPGDLIWWGHGDGRRRVVMRTALRMRSSTVCSDERRWHTTSLRNLSTMLPDLPISGTQDHGDGAPSPSREPCELSIGYELMTVISTNNWAQTSGQKILDNRHHGTYKFEAKNAPIAQLDRASDYGSEGWGFNSSWAYFLFEPLTVFIILEWVCNCVAYYFWNN